VRLALLALAIALVAPQAASAHAVLDGSTPGRGEQVDRAPARVTLRFDEPVEVAFGAVRVYDAAGKRVDRGAAEHPGGRGDEVAVGLRDNLRDGIYTTTYRVVSADSHPIAGGFVFTVGEGGAAPQASVDDLIDDGSAGPVTEGAFGVARGIGYLAIALGVGGLVFALAVWLPSLRETAGAGGSWAAASEAFAGRTRTLLLAAAGAGAVSSALGIVLQGATASATSFWSALDPDVIGEVLDTRFGTVWGLRLLAWLALGLVVALPATRVAPMLRPASLGAAGLAARAPGPRLGVAAAGLLAAFICLTPALAGHASTVDPTALLVPANAVHVTAMAIWVGGVCMLLLALPRATRRLEPADRTRLLAAAVTRFSAIATFAVAALVASGVLQAIAELEAVSELWESAFGRAILVKSGLVVALVALGAWNRRRARPRLAARAAEARSPGRTGVLLRRTLLTEVGLMAVVLGATAALASYAPPSSAQAGPVSASEELGPARLEATVDPARPGPNELHLYLFNRSDGRQFDQVKEMDVHARLPERGIGPIDLPAEKAGPGHYVVRRAGIAPEGDWQLEVSARVSEFDAYTAEIDVEIE
jgi:copper transport protein